MAKETKFFPYKEIAKKAKTLFKREKSKLEKLMPWARIEHVGSTAIPGSMTKKDVDIQIRVKAKNFERTKKVLRLFYSEHHAEFWNQHFAIFTKNDPEFTFDIMVTVENSIHDDFYKIRDYLIENPHKLAEYNELKVNHVGKDYQEYVKAKQEFFGGHGQIKFLKNL